MATLYSVIARPGVFGKLLLESPSLYISDGRLFKDSQRVSRWLAKVYTGVGTNEEGQKDCRPGNRRHEAVQDVLRLQKLLPAAGMNRKRLRVVIDECGRHDEAAWARRFPVALEFLFGRTREAHR